MNHERRFYRDRLKRVFDFTLAAFLITVTVAPMAIIGLLNVLMSGRPALFMQLRVGRYGRLFSIYKFRTMINLSSRNTSVTVSGDPRITRFGHFLRRYKLDELPQLFNVIKGDMSFVGPRPDVPGYVDRLEGRDRVLLELRPGITGPATLKYRNEEEILSKQPDPIEYNIKVIFPDKTRINCDYYTTCSLRLDLQTIFCTLGFLKERADDKIHSKRDAPKSRLRKQKPEISRQTSKTGIYD